MQFQEQTVGTTHYNVQRVYDFSEVLGSVYLITEYLIQLWIDN